MSKIEKAIEWALNIANDSSHGTIRRADGVLTMTAAVS